MRIAEITAQKDFTLLIRTDNGITGLFDVEPYLNAEAFMPLRKPGEFEQFHNGGYFVEWKCGADLSADTIESRLQIVPQT